VVEILNSITVPSFLSVSEEVRHIFFAFVILSAGEGPKTLCPCHFELSKAAPSVRREIFAAGNGRNVVKSGEECTPTYFFVVLKNDVGVNAACAARFLGFVSLRSK
jgi:hypothetical protein